MYEAVDISLTIQGKSILEHVNVAFQPGEFTAVVGPNGAGKSSLLKVIAQEYEHYQGRVLINKKIAKSFTVRELSLVRAVLPQNATVQFGFSVEQIVMLGRHAHRTTKFENLQIVDEVLALTDTAHLRERIYVTLSGGEKQRVQLARVLTQVWEDEGYPRYVLLDEPTSSLDIAQQQNIFSLARQICTRNIGVLAIIHDLNQAVQYADKLCFIKGGRIVAAGDSLNVFTKSNIEKTFCCHVNVYHDPCNNCPYIIPQKHSAHTIDVKHTSTHTQSQPAEGRTQHFEPQHLNTL